jgi:hypothetical protein
MKNQLYISQAVYLNNDKIIANENLIFQKSENQSFFKDAYHLLQINYPKFFKMDNLSKIAILGSELLLKNNQEKEIGLIFANSTASLETDLKHQESINDVDNFFPSPAIFVYTLPNICMGEVSIKHQLKSENVFFVLDKFEANHLINYTNQLFEQQRVNQAIIAWIDSINHQFEGYFFKIEKQGTLELNKENIQIIIKKWTI